MLNLHYKLYKRFHYYRRFLFAATERFDISEKYFNMECIVKSSTFAWVRFRIVVNLYKSLSLPTPFYSHREFISQTWKREVCVAAGNVILRETKCDINSTCQKKNWDWHFTTLHRITYKLCFSSIYFRYLKFNIKFLFLFLFKSREYK